MINKQLEPHGVDFDFVLANPEIDGLPWYQHYKWSSEKDAQDFEDWAVKRISQVWRCGKEFARKQFAWFNLAYGLGWQTK